MPKIHEYPVERSVGLFPNEKFTMELSKSSNGNRLLCYSVDHTNGSDISF